MPSTHGRFGLNFNKTKGRTGKVANERPKTPLIENNEHCMRVHFYIEANPVRANLCKKEYLKHYKYSTFKFYAYGIRDAYTELLSLPDWYMDLGKTAKQRQKKYIKLFYEYLEEDKEILFFTRGPLIG